MESSFEQKFVLTPVCCYLHLTQIYLPSLHCTYCAVTCTIGKKYAIIFRMQSCKREKHLYFDEPGDFLEFYTQCLYTFRHICLTHVQLHLFRNVPSMEALHFCQRLRGVPAIRGKWNLWRKSMGSSHPLSLPPTLDATILKSRFTLECVLSCYIHFRYWLHVRTFVAQNLSPK